VTAAIMLNHSITLHAAGSRHYSVLASKTFVNERSDKKKLFVC
jgi:hypothetical protein